MLWSSDVVFTKRDMLERKSKTLLVTLEMKFAACVTLCRTGTAQSGAMQELKGIETAL